MPRLATPLSALAVAGASLALVACGSSGSGSSSTNASSGAQGGTRNADFQKFQQCLKDNGVTLPNRGGNGYGPPPGAGDGTGQPPAGTSSTPPNGADGTPPAGGGGFFGGNSSDPKVQKAMKACAKYRPQGGPGANGQRSGNRARFDIKAYTPYLTCLKDQGLAIKTSDGFNALRNLKQSDPKVQAAFKACQSKLPQRPNASSATPSNTTTNGTT